LASRQVPFSVFSAHGPASLSSRINPKFSVESFAAKLPYKDPKEKEPVVEALRKAGL